MATYELVEHVEKFFALARRQRREHAGLRPFGRLGEPLQHGLSRARQHQAVPAAVGQALVAADQAVLLQPGDHHAGVDRSRPSSLATETWSMPGRCCRMNRMPYCVVVILSAPASSRNSDTAIWCARRIMKPGRR